MSHKPSAIASRDAGKNGAAARVRPDDVVQAWLPNEALLASLDTTMAGLDEEQIEERLHRDGVNEVSHEKPPHWSLQLLRAFKNPFIVVLLVLAGVQLATAGRSDRRRSSSR